MTTPTVYKWDDDGAPQLVNRTPSEMLAVIKACLVDGYGAKSGLGWTLEFEDTTTQSMVLRNSPVDGTGSYLKFWSASGGDTGTTIRCQSYKLMTDINNGTFPSYYNSMGSPRAEITSWMIVGTSKCAYIIFYVKDSTTNGGTLDSNTHFVGDFTSRIPNDEFCCLVSTMTTANQSSVNWTTSLNYLNSSSNVFAPFDVDATDVTHRYVHKAMVTPWGDFNSVRSGEPTLPVNALPTMIGTMVNLNDRHGTPSDISLSRMRIRGWLTGHYKLDTPCHGASPFGTTIDINGDDFLLLMSATGQTNNMLSLGDDW
ncbi:hypothetical protein NVP1049O_22 [Vibrio phage 1.049.O._10N.286.54.B5]|nr:hypothetical protein NVP1049O_22 [Vibrio phage 1.049.O._10N.286.54.B5]